jgi:pilus assembly protein CpaE
MAYDLAQKVPGIKVCLVDLDLLAGDVTAILEARQRVSIADVAKVSQDLDAATILDAVVRHESGVSLLLAPQLVQDSEHVTATSVRSILRLLREQFHVILVDGGSHSTPAQAAAVEIADEVVTVVTPDVLVMRSFRRLINAWEGLAVRNEQDLHVLVNRASRDDMVHIDAIAKLTSGKLLTTRLPAAFRRLEKAVNTRDPLEVREAAWWNAIEKVGAEVGVYAGYAPPPAAAAPSEGGSRAKRRKDKGEAGQVALENVALMPVILLICLLVWQIGLSALAFVWNGHAANAAVRAASIGEDPEQAARNAVPDGIRDNVRVVIQSDGSVKVSTSVPVLCPGCASLPTQITQVSAVTEEPR